MFNELTFEEGEFDLRKPYLGGGAHLPGSISWPLDRQGNPKLHLACFPLSFLAEYSDVKLDGAKLASVFVPYSKMSDDYIDEVMEEGGDVLIYSPGAQPIYGYGTDFLPPRLISVVKNQGEDSNENGIAKIGGTPCWLQDEEFTPGMSYVLQINSSRLNKAVPSHKGILVGGIGTLLLGRLDGEVQGRFIVQTT